MPPSIGEMNVAAIAQTLEHQGKLIGELDDRIQQLGTQIVNLNQELEQQKGLIVRSLQQKYGHGSTSGE
jgi:TolA-binding protein